MAGYGADSQDLKLPLKGPFASGFNLWDCHGSSGRHCIEQRDHEESVFIVKAPPPPSAAKLTVAMTRRLTFLNPNPRSLWFFTETVDQRPDRVESKWGQSHRICPVVPGILFESDQYKYQIRQRIDPKRPQ